MNNNKKRRQPKTIWDFLRECPLVSLILLSVIGYTLYALVGAMGGEYKLRISKDHTLFMSAMIKEDPFVKKDDTKKPPDDTTATGTDADSNPIPAATSTDAPATSSDAVSTDGSEPIPTTYITVPMRKARSAYYDDNDRVAQTTNYDYITVNTDYFNDAAFIGDSRIEGLHAVSYTHLTLPTKRIV